MSQNIHRNIERTKQLINNLELESIENTLNTNVSKKDVFWQCDNICRAIVAIAQGLEAAKETHFKNNMSISGKLLISGAYFPRGKGKAPKPTFTDDEITRESLMEIKRRAYEELESVKSLDISAYFKHPLFGHMNLKWASKLLYVHTKHHYKIVKNISKS